MIGRLILSTILVIFTTLLSLLTTFRSYSIFVVSLTVLSLALMPIVENQHQIYTGATSTFDDVVVEINDKIIFPFINPVLACADNFWEVWNRLVLFVESVIWRAAQEFNLDIFGHAAYESDFSVSDFFRGDDVFPHMQQKNSTSPLLSQTEIYMIEEWMSVAANVAKSREHRGGSVELEMRSRLLAYRIYRQLHYPYMQNRDILQFLDDFCGTLEDVLDAILDFVDIVIEFILFLYDLVEEAVDKLIDGDIDIEFIIIFVRAILDVFLLIIDPKGCFRNFPDGFPASVFPCFCPWVYETITDVPNNILLAILGCICPGVVSGDIISGLQVCVNYPFLKFLLEVIMFAVEIAEKTLDAINQIGIRINRIINRIKDLIDRITSIFKKREVRSFTGPDGRRGVLKHIDNGEFTIFTLEIYNNATTIPKSVKEYRVPNENWFNSFQSLLDRGLRRVDELKSMPRFAREQFIPVMQAVDSATEQGIAIRKRLGEEIEAWMKPQMERLAEERAQNAYFDSEYWKSRDGNAPLGGTLYSDLINHRLHLTFAQLIDRHSNDSFWERSVRAAPTLCGQDCVEDISHLTKFGSGLFKHAAHIMSIENLHEYKRGDLPEVEFGNIRGAMKRTAARIREHRALRMPEEKHVHRFVRRAHECGKVVIHSVFKPWLVTEQIERIEPQTAERVLGWIESKTELLDQMRQSASVSAARHLVAEEIRRFHGAKAVEVAREAVEGRFVPVIVISITVIGGAAAVVGISLAGVAAAALAPLIPFLLVLVLLLFYALFSVLVTIGTSQTVIFFTGDVQQADVFLPLTTLFEESLGNIFQNGFDTIDSGALSDSLLTIAEADGWYLIIQVLRSFLGIIPLVGKPPDVLYDPESGLALEDLSSWFFNILRCDPFEPCTIPGGYGGAECRCIESGVGRFSTVEDPCPIGTGHYHCYPFIALGTQLRGFNVPGDLFDCAAFGYERDGYLWASGFPGFLGTWLRTAVKSAQVATRRLFTGWSLPIIGIFAGLVMGFCPCLRPISGPLWKLTMISVIASPFFQFIVGDYLRAIVRLNSGTLSVLTDWADDWVNDRPFEPYEGQCAVRYSPPLIGMFCITVIFVFPIILAMIFGGWLLIIHLALIVWMFVKVFLRFFLYFYIAVERQNHLTGRGAFIVPIGNAFRHTLREHNDAIQSLYEKKTQ